MNIIQPEKGRKFDTCYLVDEPWRRYAKGKQPVTERQAGHDPTYMRHLELSTP